MATLTLRPTSGSGSNWNNIANVYDNNTATSASVSTSRFNCSSREATFTFDFSSIPDGSTIYWSKVYLNYKAGKTTIEPRIYLNGGGYLFFTPKSTSQIEDYIDTSQQTLDQLSSLTIQSYNSNWSNNTLDVYEFWIEINYSEPSYCDVTFIDWDGSILSNQTILQGADAIPPDNPTRPGYEFIGWDGSYTNVRVSTTLTAVYRLIKPVITIQSQDVTKISSVSEHDRCTVTFTANVELSYWEARATTTQTPGHGVGLLVESGTLANGATGYVYVDDEELTNGDTNYRISIYGQNSDGVWSDD